MSFRLCLCYKSCFSRSLSSFKFNSYQFSRRSSNFLGVQFSIFESITINDFRCLHPPRILITLYLLSLSLRRMLRKRQWDRISGLSYRPTSSSKSHYRDFESSFKYHPIEFLSHNSFSLMFEIFSYIRVESEKFSARPHPPHSTSTPFLIWSDIGKWIGRIYFQLLFL